MLDLGLIIISGARSRTRRGEVVGIHLGDKGVEDRRAQIALLAIMRPREIRVRLRLRLRGLVVGWRQRQHQALGPRFASDGCQAGG